LAECPRVRTWIFAEANQPVLKGVPDLMDDNEKVAVLETLKLAKLAILAMMVIMGYLGQDLIIGLI
jgi:hypothetical protein